MIIRCIWEHNGDDSLLYSAEHIGAFTRGETKKVALDKMVREAAAYLKWKNGTSLPADVSVEIVQESTSALNICDADSDVIFDSEKMPLTMDEYQELKALALKSSEDFLALYDAVPDKNKSCLSPRKSFIGQIPRTAREMYEHTKCVNTYYFGEIGVQADADGDIFECRARGFALLENQPAFLRNNVFHGSYNEFWSLRKVIRRFIWHDRIHAKAMYRMAIRTFGAHSVPDIFKFGI